MRPTGDRSNRGPGCRPSVPTGTEVRGEMRQEAYLGIDFARQRDGIYNLLMRDNSPSRLCIDDFWTQIEHKEECDDKIRHFFLI